MLIQNMNITSAALSYITKENGVKEASGIRAVIDGQEWFVPMDPKNRFYAEIKRKEASGELVVQPE